MGHGMVFLDLLLRRVNRLVEKELEKALSQLREAELNGIITDPIPYPNDSSRCHPSLAKKCALCFGGVYDGSYE